jgi:hypothetical protein
MRRKPAKDLPHIRRQGGGGFTGAFESTDDS